MFQLLEEQYPFLVSPEGGVVLAIVAVTLFILFLIGRKGSATPVSKAELDEAVKRARDFQSELSSAREGFIDNRVVEGWQKSYASDFAVLSKARKRIDAEVRAIDDVFSDLRNHVDRWNAAFIQEESSEHDAFFGRLDANQREACVADEVATLVVAGAGSGKTSTIEKKVEYLVKVRHVSPEDILLLAFTNKAADEMTERLAAALPEAGLAATTFHKFGLGIVKVHRAGSYDICEPQFCTETILHALSPDALTDEECRGLLRFFAFCLNAEPPRPNEFKTFGDYINETRNSNFQTLRGMTGKGPADKTTYSGEEVKSFQELEIANWLFLNGIAYEYERKYDKPLPPEGPVKHRHYKPDFYLPDYDIWIEHFGIDENGEPPSFFSKAEKANYKAGIVWKRNVHTSNGTTLVESYSWWHSKGELTDRLWEALKVHGVKRHGVDPKPLWKSLVESSRANFIREFARLVSSFITLAKSNRITSDTLEKVLERNHLDGNACRRVEVFLEQVRPLFRKYEERLLAEDALDFNDMINEATDRVVESPDDLHRFRYVIIDEFQDISANRAKLIQAVIAATGAKLFCVGDDWQSIYRFAGSDISIFTHFSEHFGFARTVRLENTYRNSQELLAVAGAFVMKNRQQLRKDLKSTRHCEKPIVCVPYGGSREKPEALRSALEEIAREAQGRETSVLLLGRHNLESSEPLEMEGMMASGKGEHFIWKTHRELKLTFMTVHKAKGLEADYVILLNFNDDLLGFPNTISDDPILALLLSTEEELAFAEERRVFYVALTRTKNRIYILAPTQGTSVFLEDLPREVQETVTDDGHSRVSCPKCQKGHLVLKHRSGDVDDSFYGCSNYPRCDYTLNRQRVPITCETPRCTCGGFLVPKRNPKNGGSFLGCTEYTRLQPYRHISLPLDSVRKKKSC